MRELSSQEVRDFSQVGEGQAGDGIRPPVLAKNDEG